MNILKIKFNACNFLLNSTKTVSIASSKLLPTFLLTFLILFQPISSVYAQRIASACTSSNSLDVKVVGIHNTGSKNVPGLGNNVKKVIVECSCRGRINMDLSETCPNKITLTVNGQNKTVTRIVTDKYSTWWGIAAGLFEGDMFIYRYVHDGPVTSLRYNAPSSGSDKMGMRGLTAWIVKNDAANANQPQSINIDEFHFRHAARCFNIPVKPTLAAKDMTIHLVVSEIQNNPARYTRYIVQALNASGTVIASIPAKLINRNNDASEIRLDELSFKNVPANATTIQVCIESPQTPAGTSFMIGSVAVTSKQKPSTLTCAAGKTVACASDIKPVTATYSPSCPDDARRPTRTGPVISGEPNCPGTTYTYTYSVAGLSCKQVFKIASGDAPSFASTNPKIVCEADINPVFPVYTTSCGGNATETISEPVVEGTPGCAGTIYTYTCTVKDACGRSASTELVFEIGNDCNNPCPCNLKDWRALKAIYEGTDGKNWTPFRQQGWDQVWGDSPPANCDLSKMKGVTLNADKRVVALNLFSINGLVGNFPPEVGDLSELEYLYMAGVDFMQSSIPPEIGNLSKLKELILSASNIGGTLPPELAKLTNLTLLIVRDNELSGCYPTELGALCDQLTHPRFRGNPDFSAGNNFDANWEDFCATSAGACNNFKLSESNYSIYPNPTKGKVYIEFENESEHNRTINVYDISGKHYKTISNKGKDKAVELNLNGLSKGMYIVEIQNNISNQTEKVILH